MRRRFVLLGAVCFVLFLWGSTAYCRADRSVDVKSSAFAFRTGLTNWNELHARGQKPLHASEVSQHEAFKETVPVSLLWLISISVLFPLTLEAKSSAVDSRVATITINPREVTVLRLRPEFESTIHMPEAVISVILGSPGQFKTEHKEDEPEYVYVKPITKKPAQSNLLITTKSGQLVEMELVSDSTGTAGETQAFDFLIEYRAAQSIPISDDPGTEAPVNQPPTPTEPGVTGSATGSSLSSLEAVPHIQIHPVPARAESKPLLPRRFVVRFVVSTVFSTVGLICFVLTGPVMCHVAAIDRELGVFYLALVAGWFLPLSRMWQLTFEARNPSRQLQFQRQSDGYVSNEERAQEAETAQQEYKSAA
jgi:hypothetical protein